MAFDWSSAYKAQKRLAAKRGIAFELTFEEWLLIWEESRHLNERGRGKGKYCMSRPGDKGPYAVGNVKIILFEDNSSERGTQPPTDKTKKKIAASLLGVKHTEERRRNQSIAHLGQNHSVESHKRQGESLRRTCQENPNIGEEASRRSKKYWADPVWRQNQLRKIAEGRAKEGQKE